MLQVRKVRKERKIKVKELAQSLEVSPLTIWRIERGHTRITIDRLKNIAEVLQVPVSELWVDEEEPTVTAI